MKLRYNAPVILTFSLACTIILGLAQVLGNNFMNIFVVPASGMGFRLLSLDILKLFSHALGHANWPHLIGNLSFILLIGPILEEKYGSGRILMMMLVTALVAGVINVLFFANPSLGASGIVFMLILLISITNVKEGEIPLTFIAVVLIFLVKEVFGMFEQNQINEMAHILGGVCGAIFGFAFTRKQRQISDQTGTDTGNPLRL